MLIDAFTLLAALLLVHSRNQAVAPGTVRKLPMETLKEIVIDACILLAALFIVSAEGVVSKAKGLSCGQVQTSSQAQP